MPDPGEQVAIARLGRPHGLRGAITAHSDGPTLGTIHPGEEVVVRVGGADRTLTITSRRGDTPRGILTFDGVDRREDAAALTGGEILVLISRLPDPPDPDTYYVRDLIGFTVVAGTEAVGTVADVIAAPANDCLVVRGAAGDVLIPFTHDAVVDVDERARRVELRHDLLPTWDAEDAG